MKSVQAKNVAIPEGVTDLIPPLAWNKRKVESTLLELFARWGYKEVATPTFEFYDTVAPVSGEMLRSKMYRLLDPAGDLLVLRPDMTAPIARLASRLAGWQLPLRLCYCGSVFRYEPPNSGKPRELFQAGVELIGSGDPLSDAEVIALAAECLEKLGIDGFKIGVGHVALLNRLLYTMNVSPEQRQELRIALASKDLVSLEEAIGAHNLGDLERAVIEQTVVLEPGIAPVERLMLLVTDEDAMKYLKHLEVTFKALDALGLGNEICMDMGVIRNFDYYTGMVFEIFAPGAGIPVGGGGRYDSLLGHFGPERAATGFALNIHELLKLLEGLCNLERESPPEWTVAGEPGLEGQILKEAARRRLESVKVILGPVGGSLDEALQFARLVRSRGLVFIRAEGTLELKVE